MNLSPLPFLEERTHTMTNLRIGHGYDVHRLTEGRAVGRVLAHYYDAQGRVLEAQVNNALQASVAQLKKAPRTVAVCSTLLRPQSVAGALALGVIDTLCLPLSLAQKVLDLA